MIHEPETIRTIDSRPFDTSWNINYVLYNSGWRYGLSRPARSSKWRRFVGPSG